MPYTQSNVVTSMDRKEIALFLRNIEDGERGHVGKGCHVKNSETDVIILVFLPKFVAYCRNGSTHLRRKIIIYCK